MRQKKTKTLNHGSKWAKHPNLVTRPQVSPIETTTNGEFSKHATYQVKFPGTALAIAPVVEARVFDSIDRGLVLLRWFKRQAMWMQMGGSQNGAPKWNKNNHIGKINADHWICGYLIFRYNHICKEIVSLPCLGAQQYSIIQHVRRTHEMTNFGS